MLSIGLTRDLSFRKKQLQNLKRFCEEQKAAMQDAMYADLHKHKIESAVAEIALVYDECKYMLSVNVMH